MSSMAVPLDGVAAQPARQARPRSGGPGRVLLLLCCVLLSTCTGHPPLLERVRALGVLRVAITNGPTTWHVRADGPAGFDYDLVSGFARHLGVALELRPVRGRQHALTAAATGRVHLAAAGLKITPGHRRSVRFAPPLRTAAPELVYRIGTAMPRHLDEVTDEIVIAAEDGQHERLRRLRRQHPNLHWQRADDSVETLLVAVARAQIRHTVADSDLVAMTRRHHPDLGVALRLGEPVAQGWAFPRDGDDSLFNQAIAYIEAQRRDGELARIHDRYFGHVGEPDRVGSLVFARHVESRLPRYRDLFITAGLETALDWRLLAAVSYQESHWDPAARSPTGVRGMMMLTRATAGEVGVKNRLNAAESISGGARYLARIRERLPASIPEPDRTWFALAGYNIGLGHLYDARALTRRRGGDPDRWIDVRDSLPLLADEKWHSKTRYGYARGFEAVTYVANVRTYYDMLSWVSRTETAATDSGTVYQTPE